MQLTTFVCFHLKVSKPKHFVYHQLQHLSSAFQFLAAQEIKFENTDISYGLVDKGANGERTFRFTNVGSAPLQITNTKASCG
ncbi:MAG: DUF1573 domain-containing protein [Flammeovirgaceae bacterium]